MRTLSWQITYQKRADEFRLYALGDTHLGNRACDEALLRADIARIAADPHGMWIGLGDFIDGVIRGDQKRFHQEIVAPWAVSHVDYVSKERDYFLEMVRPIARQCVGLVCGNHEAAIQHHHDRDIYSEIVMKVAEMAKRQPQSLAIGVHGFVCLRFRRQDVTWKSPGHYWTFTIYTHHGWGGGRKPGSKANRLFDQLGSYDANLVLVGHLHDLAITHRIITRPSFARGRDCEEVERFGVNVPSYLRARVQPATQLTETDRYVIDTYSERAGYDPKVLGMVPIVLQPDKRKMSLVVGNGYASA